MASRDAESPEPKTRRPDDTAFKQQRLAAWKPVITAQSTWSTFGVVGAIFLVIGGILFASIHKIKELEIEYTDCLNITSHESCADVRRNISRVNESCYCELFVNLTERWDGEVYLYYKLTNFYQNHRRYIKSRNDQQLRGDLSSLSECSPIKTTKIGNNTVSVAPCGLIANSLFNDTFQLFNATGKEVNMIPTGIAWSTDRDTKFRNPKGNLAEAFQDYAKPPNWHKPVYELSDDPNNNGFVNEDFIVWMRTAALPTFRKLHRRIRTGLSKGSYRLLISYTYPTSAFEGRKYIVLSTITWLGGKNSFLYIAYFTVGSICFTTSVLLYALQKHTGHNRSFRPTAL